MYTPGRPSEYQSVLAYWGVKDTSIVTAKLDEQKTDTTRAKVAALAAKLCRNIHSPVLHLRQMHRTSADSRFFRMREGSRTGAKNPDQVP